MYRIILALLFSINLHSQEIHIQNGYQDWITAEIERFNQLNFPAPPRRGPIVYIQPAPLHPMLRGLTRELEPGIYIIDINPALRPWAREKTILHELQHVLQLWNGDLQTRKDGFYWKGQHFPWNHPYTRRPWELDAQQAVKRHCQ